MSLHEKYILKFGVRNNIMKNKAKFALQRSYTCLSLPFPTIVHRNACWKDRPPLLPGYLPDVVRLTLQRQSTAPKVMALELLNQCRVLSIILKNFMCTDASEMIYASGVSWDQVKPHPHPHSRPWNYQLVRVLRQTVWNVRG